MIRSGRMKAAVAAAVLAAAATVAALAGRGGSGATGTEAAFLQERIDLPAVTLVDQDGQPYGLAARDDGAGLLVINFNYSTCTSICPLGNAVMQALERQMDDGLLRQTNLLSITIDPRTDTPDLLRQAAEEWQSGERWRWLTGEPADIEAVLASAGASVADIQFHDPLFLVGRAGTGFFFRSTSMPSADELELLLEQLKDT